jgi:hypothetical protein
VTQPSTSAHLVPRKGAIAPAAPAAVPEKPRSFSFTNCRSVCLPASPYHPSLSLFSSQQEAKASAELIGPPWVAVAFACGYLLTNGWHFHDTERLLSTFCPVPHECLETIQDIVNDLQASDLAPKYYPIHIKQALSDHPVLAALSPTFFEAVCLCTLMRIGYPPFAGRRDDWLTVPAWALRMPKRAPRAAPRRPA